MWKKQSNEACRSWANRWFPGEKTHAAEVTGTLLVDQLGIVIASINPNDDLVQHLAIDEIELTAIQLQLAEQWSLSVALGELKSLRSVDDFVAYLARKFCELS